MSADSIIQDPYDTQAYNRYSYVKNNPLKYTDPSGHFWGIGSWIKNHWRDVATVIAVVAVVAITGGGALGFAGLGWSPLAVGAAAGFTGGFVGTALNGGSFGQSLRNGVIGGIIGGVTAGFANGIGNFADGAGSWMGQQGFNAGVRLGTRTILHGGLSAFISKAQGGRWSSGYWAGAVGTYLGGAIKTGNNYVGNIAKNAIISGSVSRITGGKFANGAVFGAFRYMFNDSLEHGIIKLHIDKFRTYGKDGSWHQGYRADGTKIEGWAGQHDFQYYNGHAPAEKFVYGAGKFAQIMIRDHGDGLGLTLSIGAAVTTGGTSMFLGISAIGIDMLQQDPWGTGIGVGAMFMKSLTPVDIVYGIGQL